MTYPELTTTENALDYNLTWSSRGGQPEINMRSAKCSEPGTKMSEPLKDNKKWAGEGAIGYLYTCSVSVRRKGGCFSLTI